MNVDHCSNCGGKAREEQRVQKFLYGEGQDAVELSAVVPVWICDDCEDAYTDDRAEDARHDAVCAYLGRMKPSQLRASRQRFHLTQERLANITGFGIASLKRWEAGNLIQNESADRFLQLIFADERTFALAVAIAGENKSQPKFATKFDEQTKRSATAFKLRERDEFSLKAA